MPNDDGPVGQLPDPVPDDEARVKDDEEKTAREQDGDERPIVDPCVRPDVRGAWAVAFAEVAAPCPGGDLNNSKKSARPQGRFHSHQQ